MFGDAGAEARLAFRSEFVVHRLAVAALRKMLSQGVFHRQLIAAEGKNGSRKDGRDAKGEGSEVMTWCGACLPSRVT